MRYASLCDGIGAVHNAVPKHWVCAWTSEIEPFPAAVVEHRFGYKNVGDMTKIDLSDPEIRNIDALFAGTPCQGFSIAGLRGSLEDARGQLTLAYAKIVTDINPPVAVWENVPGALSTKDNAFGCLLAALVGESEPLNPEPFSPKSKYWRLDKKSGKWLCRWPDAGCVYGPSGAVAWRCLDAQYFGLAQRRKRVFVVRCPRNGADPAQILFEFGGVRWDLAPSRPTRQENPSDSGEDFEVQSKDSVESKRRGFLGAFQNTGQGYWSEHPVAQTIRSSTGSGAYESNLVAIRQLPKVFRQLSNCEYAEDDCASTVQSRDYKKFTDIIVAPETCVVIQERAICENPNAGPDGAGFQENLAYTCEARTTPQAVAFAIGSHASTANGISTNKSHDTGGPSGMGISEECAHSILAGRTQAVALCFSSKDSGQDVQVELAPTMRAMGHTASHPNAGGQLAVAINFRGREGGSQMEISDLASVRAASGGSSRSYVGQESEVRRLTVRETERLFGYADDYTLIPKYRKKIGEKSLKKLSVTTGLSVDVLHQNLADYYGISREELRKTGVNPDGKRYKCCGNTMAIPVMKFIIDRVDAYFSSEDF